MAADPCPTVLGALLPPRVRTAADWADKEAYLPASDSHPGRFRCRPYQRELLKAMSLGSRMKASGSPIKEVILCKGAQVGYTVSLMHAITFTILYRPTSIGFYFPTNDAVQAFASNQAARYFDAQPSLKGKITSEVTSDGKSSAVRKHFDNGTLRFLSATKPADVATHSFGFCLVDEADLVKDIKGEGSSFDLIKNRTQEYHDAILVIGGTPRGSFIESKTWQLYKESDERRYMIKCPKCGRPQYLTIQQFIPGANDYNDSGFRCIEESCGYVMKEHEKQRLVKEGFWKPTGNDAAVPGRAGFHISSLYADSPNCSWPNLARQREAANYDKEKLRVFFNTRLGLPTSPTDFGHLKAQDILDQLPGSDYETTTGSDNLPNDICLLTAGVDVQGPGKDARLEYSLYGWSRKKCYFLQHMAIPGNVMESEVWNSLNEMMSLTYTTKDKKRRLTPAVIFVDSGSGTSTHVVYRECMRLGNRYMAIKGNVTAGKPLIVKSVTPNTRQPLILIQTALAKDRIMQMLKAYVHNDPDAELHFPQDLEVFIAAGLTSEYRTTKPGNPPKVVWVHNTVDRNEPLDCFVYALAAKEFYTSPYAPDALWPALEKRAAGIKKTRTKKPKARMQDYGGWY